MPRLSNFEKANELGIPVGHGIGRNGTTYPVLFPKDGKGIRADGKRATICIYIRSREGRATVEECVNIGAHRKRYRKSPFRYWREYGRKSIEKYLNAAGFVLKQKGRLLSIEPKVGTLASGLSEKESRFLDSRHVEDVKREANVRKEQELLRRKFFAGKAMGKCAICGREVPISLLVIAHIKRRTRCDQKERQDFANIMPACTLGCDAMFERGFITIAEGRVKVNQRMCGTGDLKVFVNGLEGRRCSRWNPNSERYFKAHERAHSRD